MFGVHTFAEAFRGIVCQLSLALLLGLIAIAAIAWMSRTLAAPMRRLLGGGIVRIALVAAMVGTGIVESFSKHTNDPPRSLALPLPSVMPEDISNGWRVAEMREGRDLSRPLDGSCLIHEPWLVRGGFGDVVRISANGWFFPWRDGFADELSVFSDGEIRPNLRTSFFPRPFDVPLAVVPAFNWHLLTGGVSNVFWHASTSSNSLLVAWENAPVNRDANSLTNFQAEFFADGRFAYRYDDHAVDYAPVFSFDWDNDGLENSVDPNPLVAGPDAHGTNAKWYNTICSNIVNSNAYYFVDVVAERGPAPIRFTGDRESCLGNPVIVALAGETNRVPLLIGINYAVTSDTPFSVSFPVDYTYVEMETNEPCVARIRWPLDFQFTESIGVSNRTYAVTVVPYDPGGEFEWGANVGEPMRGEPRRDGGCSCVSYGANSVTFSCLSTCTCGGDCKARGRYIFEMSEFAIEGGECRCGLDDPPGEETPSSHDPTNNPSLTITFSKPAVIFENAYEDYPGVVRPRRSTRVRLTVDAYGGPDGGTLSLAGTMFDKLTAVDGGVPMPFNQQLAEGTAYHASGVYEGVLESDSDRDVIVSGSFVPSGQGGAIQTDAHLTVVRVEIRENVMAIANPFAHRRLYGIGEDVKCIQHPSVVSVQWRTNGGGSFSGVSPKMFSCPLTAETSRLNAEYGSAYLPVALNVIEPERIECDYAEFLDPAPDVGCGMRLHLVVHPFMVSFSNLEMQEIPADLSNWQQWGSHSGYFGDYSFYHRWCHTTAWGAGVWYPVDEFNSIGFDTSRIWLWPQPWSTGTLSWTIPYGWRRKDSMASVPVGQINPPSYSVWTMSSNFLEKTKHSHRVGVSSDGQMYFEGTLQNENH